MACFVEVEKLSKMYGGFVAVKEVSFTASKGSTALMGPNGSGKTTTLSMIAGSLKPTSGTVRICGLDLWGGDGVKARKLLGYAPQDMPFKDKLTALENLTWIGMLRGLWIIDSRREALRVLEDVGLRDHAGKKVAFYSGGMRRRLAIASAIIHNPEVIILDEPGSGLDPVAREGLWEILRRLASDRTLIYSTHIAQEAEAYSDTIAIFYRGSIVDMDEPQRLIARHAPLPQIIVHTEGEGPLIDVEGSSRAYRAGGAIVYEARDTTAMMPRVVEAYISRGIPVVKVEVRKPGLEDVFFKLTGTRLEVE